MKPPALTPHQQMMNFLRRVPKRATLAQIRASFREEAEPLLQGALSRGYVELRDEYYYPTAAGKRALADYMSTRR